MISKRTIDDVEEELECGKRVQRGRIHTEGHQRTVAFLMTAQRNKSVHVSSQESQECQEYLNSQSSQSSQSSESDTWSQKPYW